METIIADTGFGVALANASDPKHEIVTKTSLQPQNIFLPQTVSAEVAYLSGREVGIKTVPSFLNGLSNSRFSVIAMTSDDIFKTAGILELRNPWQKSCLCCKGMEML